MLVERRLIGRPDRSDARRDYCEAIARRAFPTADEINVRFFGPTASPFVEVWHAEDGRRRCAVIRVEE